MVKSKRTKLIVLATSLLLVLAYSLSYLYFRKQHAIVHFQAYSYVNHHRVEAVYPDGRLFFLAIVQLAKDTTEFKALEQRTWEQVENKVAFLNCFYLPARKEEVVYWNIFKSKPKF